MTEKKPITTTVDAAGAAESLGYAAAPSKRIPLSSVSVAALGDPLIHHFAGYRDVNVLALHCDSGEVIKFCPEQCFDPNEVVRAAQAALCVIRDAP